MKKIIIVLLALSVSINTIARPNHKKKDNWLRECFINGNKKDVKGNIIVTAIAIGFGVFMVTGSITLNNINNNLKNR